MELSTVWFLLIAVLWTGYLVLEGFDFGVGMLLPVLGRRDTDRRVMINTIGPVWDGNEVWLLTAGGATFAAFPEWYATMFSGFYLALLLILLALIVRVVAFEWRGKINDDAWRRRSDWALIVGSWVPAVLWGVAFANLVRGVDLDASHEYVGGFFALLNPFALLGGVMTALVFLTHGAIFLALKSGGDVRDRAATLAARIAPLTLVVSAAWAIWAQLAYSVTWTWAAVGVAAAGLVATVLTTRARREGWAFVTSVVTIVGAVVLIFGSLYPDVVPAFDPANSLTVTNASSSHYTLTVLTWVAVVLVPFVLLYQGWTYWVFRKRVFAEHIPDHAGLTFMRQPVEAGLSAGPVGGASGPDGTPPA
jgi:cytochrome d ubiquinol oxidase subunit II